jgi:very-short-patch-repair endonuclease
MKKQPNPEPITYNPIQKTNENPILTKAESNFNEYLKKIIPSNLIINYKTRLADLIKQELIPEKHLNKILQMHIDFILIDKNGNVILAIELDDSSHNTQQAKERDAIKNDILEKANIPLLRVPNAIYYNLFVLKKSIQSKIKKPLCS